MQWFFDAKNQTKLAHRSLIIKISKIISKQFQMAAESEAAANKVMIG